MGKEANERTIEGLVNANDRLDDNDDAFIINEFFEEIDIAALAISSLSLPPSPNS